MHSGASASDEWAGEVWAGRAAIPMKGRSACRRSCTLLCPSHNLWADPTRCIASPQSRIAGALPHLCAARQRDVFHPHLRCSSRHHLRGLVEGVRCTSGAHDGLWLSVLSRMRKYRERSRYLRSRSQSHSAQDRRASRGHSQHLLGRNACQYSRRHAIDYKPPIPGLLKQLKLTNNLFSSLGLP